MAEIGKGSCGDNKPPPYSRYENEEGVGGGVKMRSAKLSCPRILETALYAEDLETARSFYVDILCFEEISFDPDRDLFLKADGSVLIIFKASRTKIPDSIVPPHGTVGNGHVAFSASEAELEAWKARMGARGIEIIKEINWKNGARSIYFNDPAGNVLEFATPDLWGVTKIVEK